MTEYTDRTVAIRGLVAAILAAAVNAGIVAVARAVDVAPGFEPLSYPPTVFLTVLTAIAATFVFAAVRRLSTNPRRTFVRVAVVALVLSLLPDVLLLQVDSAATLAGVIVLMVMHVVAAAVDVRVLTRGVGDVV